MKGHLHKKQTNYYFDFGPLLPDVVLVGITPHAINFNFSNELSPSQTSFNPGYVHYLDQENSQIGPLITKLQIRS